MHFDFILKNKPIFLVLVIISVIAGIFWMSSRYPALSEKAMMGDESPIDGLSFGALIEVKYEDPVYLKIAYNTINWMHTNRQGMTFGWLLAAALILLFTQLSERQFKGRFANTVMGVLVGAPLGVCVNCAAPIAKGIYDAGGRVETTLSSMISSPTMNVIVLTMLFTLFPFHIAVIKIGITVLFIFVGIPMITKLLSGQKTNASGNAKLENLNTPLSAGPNLLYLNLGMQESWVGSAKWVTKNYFRSLWYIFKKTVPLMILAGLLGNVLVTIIPWQSLSDLFEKEQMTHLFHTLSLPDVEHNMGRYVLLFSITFLLIAAFLGTILPVPMAFDVIISAILLVGGMPIQYVATLLFTLGIFSIYSYFITVQTINFKMATGLFVGIVIFGIGSGFISAKVDRWYQVQNKMAYLDFKNNSHVPGVLYEVKYGSDQTSYLPSADRNPYQSTKHAYSTTDSSITMSQSELHQKKVFGDQLFNLIEGPTVGIKMDYAFKIEHMMQPHNMGRGIATGDINNDQWSDLVVADYNGISIFRNRGNIEFIAETVELSVLDSVFVFNAMLADMNNDSWLDLIITTYRSGNYLILNDGGKFKEENISELPNITGAVMTSAISAGDIDADGDLDLLLGNWTIGQILAGTPKYAVPTSKDVILFNHGNNFELQTLSGFPGESLSVLISDWNNDGKADLIVGNDHYYPDQYYYNNGEGTMQQVLRSDSIIPNGTNSTMSVTTADINNDLIPDIFQAPASDAELDFEFKASKPTEICEHIKDPVERKNCLEIFEVQSVLSRTMMRNMSDLDELSEKYQWAITGINIYEHAMLARMKDSKHKSIPESWCDYYPKEWRAIVPICSQELGMYSTNPPNIKEELPNRKSNSLLIGNESGRFENQTRSFDIMYSGWSWTAKFADLDLDEWQDTYIINGFIDNRIQNSNLLFRNVQGSRFENKTIGSGLQHNLPTHAYSYVDIDNDGDIDIIAVPVFGPLMIYINNSEGKSIEFEIRDEKGNSAGIGCKVYIIYGQNKSQFRELQLGGGFRSFDAPIAHFGLGDHDYINSIQIQWSTGEITSLKGNFASGHRYIINRKQKPNS